MHISFISQGSVKMYLQCGGIYNNHKTYAECVDERILKISQ